MIAWINFAALLFASLGFLYFYVLSVSPATREKILGSSAYRICGRDRIIAGFFEAVTVINYAVAFFYPLDTPLPDRFPWPWWVSATLGVAIGAPALGIMVLGLRDAGAEAIRPRREHGMFGGIYRTIRHPQAVGEVFAWIVLGLLLHSPFLVAFSLIYFPIFLIMCFAEEQDLLWRYGDAYAEYARRTGRFWPKRM